MGKKKKEKGDGSQGLIFGRAGGMRKTEKKEKKKNGEPWANWPRRSPRRGKKSAASLLNYLSVDWRDEFFSGQRLRRDEEKDRRNVPPGVVRTEENWKEGEEKEGGRFPLIKKSRGKKKGKGGAAYRAVRVGPGKKKRGKEKSNSTVPDQRGKKRKGGEEKRERADRLLLTWKGVRETGFPHLAQKREGGEKKKTGCIPCFSLFPSRVRGEGKNGKGRRKNAPSLFPPAFAEGEKTPRREKKPSTLTRRGMPTKEKAGKKEETSCPSRRHHPHKRI